jgi:hypothetical protein
VPALEHVRSPRAEATKGQTEAMTELEQAKIVEHVLRGDQRCRYCEKFFQQWVRESNPHVIHGSWYLVCRDCVISRDGYLMVKTLETP